MFQGSMVALVTPMTIDGAIDQTALLRFVDFHINEGTNAIVAVGTTGESATLDEDEHCSVIAEVVKHVDGRVPVIAGTGANSTREAISLTQCAKDAGADGCLLVTPYYNKPTQEGLFLHHKAVAEAVDIPQLLYNVPGRTACDMLPETVARLAEIPNIVGIKEATGDLARLAQLQKLCGDDFDFISGDDGSGMEFMLQGGHGVISVTANVAPRAMRQMCDFARAGNRAEAEAINARLNPLHEKLFVEANPIPVKWALTELGHIPAGIRLPLTPLSAMHHEAVRAALKHAELL